MFQVKTFKPQLVAVRNESLVGELKEALADADYKPEIVAGEQGVIEVSSFPYFSEFYLSDDRYRSHYLVSIAYKLISGCPPP